MERNEFSDLILQVQKANDIVDVIGGYIELRQRGNNWWARCPFHGEKTPSFSVTRTKQFYKCFGCGESGNVFSFVMKYESCEFYDALKLLAGRAGIKMPESRNYAQEKQLAEKKAKQDLYLEIIKETARFYFRTLYSEKGAFARSYLAKRGISTEVAKKFGLGLSPDMSSLVEYLTKKYNQEDCIACGVLSRSQRGRVFDALSERLIVPIFNISSQVIAFGGRVLYKEQENFGKYKNTADTPVFTKANNLFAANLTKTEKQQGRLKYLIVVEGYMDVIALYQAGFTTAVASMGTSLTQRQAWQLARLADTVYICYDGDWAGKAATWRGLDILKAEGLEVLVVSVPENKDPDEYVKAYGNDAFEELLKTAQPLTDYKLKIIEERNKDFDSADSAKQNAARAKYASAAIKVLRDLTDEDEQHSYINKVSQKSGYTEEYLYRKIRTKADTAQEEIIPDTDSEEIKALYFVAGCLLNKRSYATLPPKPTWCDSLFLTSLFNYLYECKDRNEEAEFAAIFNPSFGGTQLQLKKLTDMEFTEENEEADKQYFEDCIKLLKLAPLERERNELLHKLNDADSETQNEIIVEIEEITKKIDKLKIQ